MSDCEDPYPLGVALMESQSFPIVMFKNILQECYLITLGLTQ